MPHPERTMATTAVYLFLRKENEILFGRRCNTGYRDGFYQVPAGHIDTGEVPTDTLIREAKEEIGINLKVEDIRLIHTSFRLKHDETGDRVDFYFEAARWTGDIRNMEPNKCDELGWFKIDALPENTTPHVRHAIHCVERGEVFSELGREFLEKNGY